MMEPAGTTWPAKTFTPSRLALESRPFLEEPRPFLCAISLRFLLRRGLRGRGLLTRLRRRLLRRGLGSRRLCGRGLGSRRLGGRGLGSGPLGRRADRDVLDRDAREAAAVTARLL